MRHRLVPAAVAAGALAILAAPSGALAAGRAPAGLQCSGSETGGTYVSVTVPADQSCSLTDVKVLGSLVVDSDAYASVTDSSILGNVSVGTDGAGLDLNTSADDGPLSSSPMTVDGNLLVAEGGYADVNPGAIVGGSSVLSGAEDLQVTQATVHDIVSQSTSGLYVYEADVDGDIASNDAQAGGSIDNNTIHGSVLINATQAGQLGDWYITGPPQTIGGSVVLTGNQAPVYLYGNTIAQSLACAGNSPAPSSDGEPNQVDGLSLGQCARLLNSRAVR